jgi:1-acyl-sn-glycerol-3-phosphate acyltransferase
MGASTNASSDFPPLGPASRALLWLLLQWFRRTGWTAQGSLPPDRKLIILGASHTSNWDFPVFLGTVHAIGRRVRFIGKHSLFGGPLGPFMRSLGGVPVDRGASQDLVGQIVEQMRASDDFLLIVAAEGTRARTTKWRTGFYQIALRAKVPIVCAGPDYPDKRGIFGPVIHPTGDYARDMTPAFAFFRSLRPRYPARAAFPGDPD